MLRRLRVGMSAVFAFAAIAICVLWARSNRWTDTWTCHPHGISPFYIESSAGRLGFGFANKSERDYPRFFAVAHTPIHDINAIRAALDKQLCGAAGFGVITSGNCELVVPHLFAALFATVLVALPWSRMTRRLGARLALSLLISLVSLLGALVWLDRAWSAK